MRLLVNNDEIAKTFNKHFAETVEKLKTFEWSSNNEDLTEVITKKLPQIQMRLIVNNNEIAKTFIKHLAEAAEKLNTFEWPSNNEDLTEKVLTKIIKRFKNHPSIVIIKSKPLIQEKFSFQPVSAKDVESVIKSIPRNKASGGNIPIQIVKQSGFTYQILTDCINDAINKGVFPDSLKIANITPTHEKDEPTGDCIAFIIRSLLKITL